MKRFGITGKATTKNRKLAQSKLEEAIAEEKTRIEHINRAIDNRN